LYPVSGKVFCKGQPAAGATVCFAPKDAGNRFQSQAPQGVVGEDGTFTLASSAGPGAAPGDYVVLIEWKEGAGKGRAAALNAPDRLKRRYLNPAQPLLQAEVKPMSNTLPPFEVQ
jgi:hypothetical protein